MKRIEQMTPEQAAALPAFREQWRAYGLDTRPVDVETARTVVRNLYAAGDAEPPVAVIVLASPMACLIARAIIEKLIKQPLSDNQREVLERKLRDQLGGQLRDQLWSQLGGQLGDQLWGQLWDQLGGQLWGQLRDQLGGQLWDQLGGQLGDQLGGQLGGQLFQSSWMVGGQDAFWLAFYEYGKQIGARYGDSAKQHFEAYKAYALNAGWLYPYKSVAFVSDRPAEIHFDAQRRLHAEAGMAVRFRDGWGLHAWHGMRIPARLIEERHQITPASIEAEPNAELRRVALEIYGFDRYCAERGARVIAEDELHGQPRRLLEVLVGGERVRIVEVINGSLEPDGTRRRFHLGAMPGETPHDVIAASYGIAPKVYREAVRT